MSFEYIILIFMILLTVGGALGTLFISNILHAAMSFLVALFGIAGLFVFAGGGFVGIAQIMIYIGGVVVLMVFGIMYTNRIDPVRSFHNKSGSMLAAVGIVASLFTLLYYALDLSISAFITVPQGLAERPILATENLGIAFLSEYILAFELIAVLLLVALVGAIYVADKRNRISKNKDA